jgi:hypothetical protein
MISGSVDYLSFLKNPTRQVLQRGEPQRQIPTEGNPPAVLAPQRTGSPLSPPRSRGGEPKRSFGGVGCSQRGNHN